MSAGAHSAGGANDHAHGAGSDRPHATLKGYLIGFALSVVLTAIPFWLVMTGTLGREATAIIILALAAIQIVVHMIFFLHMTPSSEGGWSIMALAFTVIMVVITLTGSLWIMYHLNANMMPDMSKLP